MAIRFYIMPIVRVASTRGPKYFSWSMFGNPTSITCRWNIIDYGLIDQCIAVADVTAAQHTTLAAYSDVLALPINLDATMTATAVNIAKNYLEDIGIPAQWVTTSNTYRDVLRVVASTFLYVQRVTAILGRDITLRGGVLNLQMRDIAADIRAAMQQAAGELEFDYTDITATTTVRQLLKTMADAWGSKQIYMGIATL